jgi:hypothetical protein
MEQITLKANINECIVENWQSNTGEINARVMNVEMCDNLCSCARQFVTFELTDGTVYESLVVDGKAKIPFIEKPQFIKIGLYAENINGDECEKRYSAHPANEYVNMGSYKDATSEKPIPTPGDYAKLLEQIKGLENGTIKSVDEVNLSTCESGVYLTSKIEYMREPFFQPAEYITPGKALLVVDIMNGGDVQFMWFSSIWIISGISNSTRGFEHDFNIYTLQNIENAVLNNDVVSKIEDGVGNKIPTVSLVMDYVNETIGGIENGSY